MFSVIERINKRSGNENERAVKEHLCKMNGISYYEVSANNHYELADKCKKMFQEKNIYILSNSQEDIEKCKKAFFQMERYYTTVTSLDFLGLLVYNASIPNKRDALLWRAIQCIKVTPYTKSYTNILIS